MLAYILALVIGLGSLALYMAAFFFPEVHRKTDFFWSLLGLFYALVLWVCAGRITGGVLLGQIASVALLGGFAWQTLTLRRAIASPEQQTPIPNELPANIQGLQQKVTGLFKKGKSDSELVADARAAMAAKQTETQLKEVAKPSPTPEVPTSEVVEIVDKSDTPPAPELVPPKPPAPELVEAAQKSAFLDIEASTEEMIIPIEVIAPEVELAPPAEPPGRGGPEDRIVEADNSNSPDSENPNNPA